MLIFVLHSFKREWFPGLMADVEKQVETFHDFLSIMITAGISNVIHPASKYLPDFFAADFVSFV